MKLFRLARSLRKQLADYKPSIQILISKSKLLGNFREYQKKYSGTSIAPVLKSNAYGHGLVEVAQLLDSEPIAFFALDSLHEAMVLRNEGVRSRILIIGYTQSNNITHTTLNNIAFTITSLQQLEELSRQCTSTVAIHLKIDTGMHRQGILVGEVDKAIKIIETNPLLNLEGICSHFADADGTDQQFTLSQVKQWEEIVSRFTTHFPKLPYIHISNSAGAAYASRGNGNVIRLGLGLYGIYPAPEKQLHVRPVLQMESIISSVKRLQIGDRVGYNGTFAATNPMTIATVPAGYFEGVDRRLSNLGCFRVNNKDCRIVGRVSMNSTSIDVSALSDIKLGDPIQLISDNPIDNNSVEHIAEMTKTIPWEIFVHIPQHVRRTIVA